MNWYPLITRAALRLHGLHAGGVEASPTTSTGCSTSGWAGLRGGLALGTIGLMVLIAALNGLSVAGMAIGAPSRCRSCCSRGYDKVMVTGVIQAGSSLGILIPPSVVLVLYAMIARQPVATSGSPACSRVC